jgi:hypothetical protein
MRDQELVYGLFQGGVCTSQVISAFTTASEPRQNMGIGGLAGGTFGWALVISFTVL